MKKENVAVVKSSEPAVLPFLIAIGLALLAAISLWSGSVLEKIGNLETQMRAVQSTTSAGKLNFRLEEKEWQALYVKYNEDYFNGKLPKARVVSEEMPADICGATNASDVKHIKIRMNPLAILGPKHAREVLLHEMIHVKMDTERPKPSPQGGGWVIWSGQEDHGADYRQELHRLIGLGAFDDLLS